MAESCTDKALFDQLTSDTKSINIQVQKLKSEILKVENSIKTYTPDKDCTEANLADIREENKKFLYRRGILTQALLKEKKIGESMVTNNIQQFVQRLMAVAVYRAYPNVSTPPLPLLAVPNSKGYGGEYKSNVALELSKTLAEKGVIINPRDLADKLSKTIPPNDVITSSSITGAGFLNLKVDTGFICKKVQEILAKGVLPPDVEKKRVVVDFSSPNIAKEMHVGHLRSTIIGESICRMLEFCGHDVLRLNHVGDWGTQFGMLIAHLQDIFPDYESITPVIQDLQAFYKASKTRFDEEEDFKKRAYEAVVALQSHEPKVYNAWKKICEISRNEFQVIYDRLGISIIERGESFYHSMMPDLVEQLKLNGLLTLEEGRFLFFLKDKTSLPLTIVKSDGGYTYDTSDLAAIRHRIREEKAQWIIYVVDRGQSAHFQSIFEAAKIAGYLDDHKVRVNHVEFGLVLGEDKKKFKTRSGDTVQLANLLDKGLEKSMAHLTSKGRDKELTTDELRLAQESVAYSCIKYADLCHDRRRDYVFSFNKMLEDRGNTAVYLLYMLTRIRSIIRSSKLTPEQIESAIKKISIVLEVDVEIGLGMSLLRFPEVIYRTVDTLLLHQVCEYLYDLSCSFSSFYDKCYCMRIDKETDEVLEINMNRILLCEATARVFETGFHILGIIPVSRM
ncbi:Arginyl-tRNA synthetase [Oopsacas minuta]|uniref:arginine--tRNA ligase n=1 Tax=Oopsacas minuta TaxID=111878 RepID=A0AAV7KCY6_9METZ|nr:Arginyl-tRNA synthetase [Oopsacas minuta]